MPGRGGKRRENHQHEKLKGSDFFHVSGDFFMCKVIQFLENNKEVSSDVFTENAATAWLK